MAKAFNTAFVMVLLPLILLQLQWHTAPAEAAVVTVNGAASRDRRTLVSEQPQLTAGGVLPPRAHSPTPSPSPALSFGNSEKDEISPAPPLDSGLCTYKIRTQTGNQWTAGTDATISVRLENSDRDNIYIVLTAGNINTGDQDTYSIQGRCVPHICRMILYTDSKGWLPCWYAEFVDVSVTPLTAGTPAIGASDYQKWEVSEWLPPHEWSSASSLIRDHCPN